MFMYDGRLRKKIEALQDGVNRLVEHAEQDPARAGAILPAVVKDLASAVDELRLVEVKLRQRDEESAAIRKTLQADQHRWRRPLREEQGAAEAYLDIVAAIVVAIDAEQKVTLINEAGCKLLALSRDQIVGKNWFDHFLPAEHRERTRAVFKQLICGQIQPVEYFENPILTGRGQSSIIEWHNTVLRDETGAITGTLSSGLDVTERRSVEQALQRHRQELQDILDSVHALIFYKDTDNRIVRVNRAFADAMGMTKEQMEGKSCFELWPEQAESYWQDDKEVIRTGQPKIGIIEPVETAAGLRWVSTDKMPYRDEQGNVIGVIGFAVDITDRREAEQALRLSEQRYRRLVDNALVGVYRTNLEGQVLYANETLMRIFEFASLEEMRACSVLSLYQQPRDRQAFLERLKRDGMVANYELQAQTRTGRPITISVSATLVGQELSGMLSDITERKEAEEQVRLLNEQLEQRVRDRTAELAAVNKELEAFAYSVSHDLRTPLRAIDGFSQALTEDYGEKLDQTAKDYLGRVRAASQRMGRLIDDLLKLSRLTRCQVRHEPVDLSAFARSIAAELQQQEPDRPVRFVIADGVTACGDPTLLRVVLENLLGNAFKFTRNRREARIEFGAERSADRTVYFVRDNGVGFEMQYAEKLFGAFQRLHAEGEFEGSGIGLATVQRIISRHGGRVWAQATVNKGATFRFSVGPSAEGRVSERVRS